MTRNIILILLGYLAGSVPFCYIIAKIKHRNLTQIGDRNPGGWNLAFNVSKFWGLIGIIFDMAKGFLPFYLINAYTGSASLALVAGCAAVAGHNLLPLLKFSGGKGMATLLGFLMAINPFSVLAFGVGILLGLFLIRNMIWGVLSGISGAAIFLLLYYNSAIYIFFWLLLFLIIIPKYLNHNIAFIKNFKFKKEKSLKNLFTPKIR
ncbi:MAG: glycerol-3-phosphate acyltransferase [Actinomycetota bacterium]|nr:glycerol-3-phosphate acyltransferase [Actinomycetota bacterium]